MSQKITLENKIKVNKTSSKFRFGLFKSNRSKKKRVLLSLGFAFVVLLLVLAALGIYLVVIPTQNVLASANKIISTFQQLSSDFESKDLSNIDTYFNSIQSELDQINYEVAKYSFLQDLEITRGYYDNLQVVRELTNETKLLLDDLLPEVKVLLNSLGYKSDSDGIAIPESEQNVGTLVQELPRIIEIYNKSEPRLLGLISIFNRIDTNYIPSIGIGGLKSKIISAQALTEEFPTVSAQIKDAIGMLPQLLGSESPTNYLLILQNEKEMRSSGGLLTSYGNLIIDKGKIVDDISVTDMWDLEGYISWTLGIDVGYRNIYGQNALMNGRADINYYGCGATYLRVQDSGIYPDLYVTMDMFKDYYDVASRYNPTQYPAYDHILIFNTFFASDLLSVLGDVVTEDGTVLTADNVAKEIFAHTKDAPFDPLVRKAYIAEVAEIVKKRFDSLSASDFPKIAQAIIRTIQSKNLAFYSHDAAVQSFFDELGLSARTEHNFTGDYFHLNEAQICALKSNFYVYDTVQQDIYIPEVGPITKKVHVEWVNEKVYDASEENILSASASFQYRAWVRLMNPQGTKVLSTNGFEKSWWFYWPVSYFDKVVQKEISDNIIWFDQRRLTEADPIKRHSLEVELEMPENIKYDPLQGGYRLLIQKHPGKKDEKYTINIHHNGLTTTVEFVLDRDKVIIYNEGAIIIDNYDQRLDPYYDMFEKLNDI